MGQVLHPGVKRERGYGLKILTMIEIGRHRLNVRSSCLSLPRPPNPPPPAATAPCRAAPPLPDGKARSATNTTRHGLRGTSRAIPPEDAAALAEYRDAL